jgi:CRISPR-associated protein (TIGR03986 family)
MATGRIIEFRQDRGFGFIQPEGGKRLFFHINDARQLGREPQVGDRVDFEEGTSPKGPKAINVRPVGAAVVAAQPARQPGGARPRAGGAPRPTSTQSYRFLNPYNFVRYLNKKRPNHHVLGNCPPPPHDRYTGLTGTITCRLTNVTPLFIADTEDSIPNFTKDGHNAYRFFRVLDDKGDKPPALPATSLRGMVRSIFEAVTNSCFGVFEQDEEHGQKSRLEYRDTAISPQLIPARVVSINSNSATLELFDCAFMGSPPRYNNSTSMVKTGAVNEYQPRVLQPAKNGRSARAFSPAGRIPPGVADGERVAALVNTQPTVHRSGRFQWFSVEHIVSAANHATLKVSAGQQKVFGYLHLTGPNIENKHDERLFFRWDDVNETPRTHYSPQDVVVDNATVDEFNRSLARYWERHSEVVEQLAKTHRHPTADTLPFPSEFVQKGNKLKPGDLVYYYKSMTGSQHIYPVAIPRREYRFPREALLPKHVCRCQDLQTLCPACRTFGWVHEQAEADRSQHVAYAGRVRFSMGRLERDSPLQFLDSDQPDGIPLAILGTPKPTTTLFYLLQSNGKPANGSTNYNDRSNRLRGRKVYRHIGDWNSLSERQRPEYRRAGNERDKQNRTVFEVLAPGAQFTFQVNFEHLQPVELGALLWSLQLEDSMVHRLGFAKPLGFGSVKIDVTAMTVYQMTTRYSSLAMTILEGLQADADPVETPHPSITDWLKLFMAQMETLYCEKGMSFGDLVNVADLRSLLSSPKAPLPVHYPRQGEDASTDGENFKWFMGNKRRVFYEGRGRLLPPQFLPVAVDDHVGLTLMDNEGNPL